MSAAVALGEIPLPNGGSVRMEDHGHGLVALVSPSGATVYLRARTEPALDDALAQILRRESYAPADGGPPASFADKVETLARLIEAHQRDARRDAARVKVRPSRHYWYIDGQHGGALYGVEVATGAVRPVQSGAMMKMSVPLDAIGEFDWGTRYYQPQPAASPVVIAWLRSPLPPPAPPRPKREPTVRLETAPPALSPRPWSPRSSVSSGATRTRNYVGGSQDGWTGGRYEGTRGLPLPKVASLVRADIKRAVADGALPRSVDIRVSTSGNHMTITVDRVGADLQVVDPRYAATLLSPPEHLRGRVLERYTPAGEDVLANLHGIASAYNFDHSDSSVDYFHRRFYLDVKFADHALLQQAYDLVTLGHSPRRDVYLEASVRDALRDTKRYTHDRGLVAYETADPGVRRLQWADFDNEARPNAYWPARVLAEADAPPGDAVEVAAAWFDEFSPRRKKNGARRRGPGRAVPRRR